MKSSKQISLGVAFVLNGEALERLVEILGEYSTSLRFSVVLSDQTKVYPETVEELIKLPNPEHRQITQITIENDYNSRVRVEISLGGESRYYSVWFSLAGEEPEILFLDRQITDWLATIGQWYSWLAFNSANKFMLLATVFLVATALGFSNYVIPHLLPGKQVNFSLLTIIGAVLAWGVLLVPGFVGRLFPGAVFSIGAGSARYAKLDERRKQWRLWTIATTVVLGVVLAVVLKILHL